MSRHDHFQKPQRVDQYGEYLQQRNGPKGGATRQPKEMKASAIPNALVLSSSSVYLRAIIVLNIIIIAIAAYARTYHYETPLS